MQNGTFNNVTVDGAELVTIDGTTVGYLTGASGSTLTLAITNSAAFAAVNQGNLHVVSVAYYGNYDSIVIGDHGSVTQDVSGPRDTTKPLPPLPQEIQTTERDRTIQTHAARQRRERHDLRQRRRQHPDRRHRRRRDRRRHRPCADPRRPREARPLGNVTPYTGCATQLGCFVNPLFQDLTGTQKYSTAIGATTAGEGALLNDGKPQLNPQGHASWGDYRITQLAMDPTAPDALVSAGNDYIAGGPGADMIFGELGNDTIQGDSSIDYVAHRYVPIGAVQPVAAYATSANCTAGGHPGTTTVGDRVGACIDPTNALLIDPSVVARERQRRLHRRRRRQQRHLRRRWPEQHHRRQLRLLRHVAPEPADVGFQPDLQRLGDGARPARTRETPRRRATTRTRP